MTVARYRIGYHPAAPLSERYSAIDDDTYDGAPDAGAMAHAMGWGATADEAVDDLRRLLQEYEDMKYEERGE